MVGDRRFSAQRKRRRNSVIPCQLGSLSATMQMIWMQVSTLMLVGGLQRRYQCRGREIEGECDHMFTRTQRGRMAGLGSWLAGSPH